MFLFVSSEHQVTGTEPDSAVFPWHVPFTSLEVFLLNSKTCLNYSTLKLTKGKTINFNTECLRKCKVTIRNNLIDSASPILTEFVDSVIGICRWNPFQCHLVTFCELEISAAWTTLAPCSQRNNETYIVRNLCKLFWAKIPFRYSVWISCSVYRWYCLIAI